MTVTVDITESQCLQVLRAFLLSILDPSVEVLKGQINRVAEPIGTEFVIMWPTLRRRLATNEVENADIPGGGHRTELQQTEFTVQLDVHGDSSGDNSQIISTLLRDEVACQAMGSWGLEIQPLYSSDPRQIPFINAEQQFEYRWVIDAVLQVNPTVSTVQQFADAVTVGIISVDARYPP